MYVAPESKILAALAVAAGASATEEPATTAPALIGDCMN